MKAAVLVASILPVRREGGGAEEPTACFVLAGSSLSVMEAGYSVVSGTEWFPYI